MTTTWLDLEHSLAHTEWNWIVLDREPALSLFTPGDGSLGVHDAALTTAQRADLCREAFAPTILPPDGRFWLWRPPHARRIRDQPLGWGVAHQRDQWVLYVLQTVLHASPDEVLLELRVSREVG